MGHEDRERKFERALARHLRGDGARARNEADARADVRSEPGETELCPDAGTLAAFHEGLLLNEEMNTTTEHIAGCSRCQQVLLHLEATDDIPLPVEMENELKIREPVLSTGASDVDYAAPQKPSATNAGQPKPSLKTPMDISQGRGFKALRWAAPVGAIAAGLLIWFVVQTNRPAVNKTQATAQSENVQVTQEQPRDERLAAPPPSPAARAPAPVAKAKQLDERRQDDSRIKQRAFETDTLSTPKNSVPDAVANRMGADSNDASPDAKTRQLRRESKEYASGTAAGEKPSEISSRQADVSVTAAAPAPVASGDVREQSAASAGGAAKTAAKPSANAGQTIETHPNGDSLAVPTDQVVENGKLELSPAFKKGAVENAKIILAPKGRVRWRLGAAGKIERSSDGGVSWLAQDSGVNVELLAGSAPSNAVCWIVGRGGTILKTTDGGGHWSKVASPDAGDISGIEAVDAMHAIVYDVTAVIPARLATNDGGLTWFRTNK